MSRLVEREPQIASEPFSIIIPTCVTALDNWEIRVRHDHGLARESQGKRRQSRSHQSKYVSYGPTPVLAAGAANAKAKRTRNLSKTCLTNDLLHRCLCREPHFTNTCLSILLIEKMNNFVGRIRTIGPRVKERTNNTSTLESGWRRVSAMRAP